MNLLLDEAAASARKNAVGKLERMFIVGFGIPADLDIESLTEGYVLKAEFWLPYNATVFRESLFPLEYPVDETPINRRSNSIMQAFKKPSNLRWNVYAYIVERLNSHGYHGQECMLKAICEANTMRFSRQFDVFTQLMHIFFSPSSSADGNTSESEDYKQAERMGRTGAACNIYACEISLINWISNVFKVDFD